MTIVLRRFDHRGELNKHEVVAGGRQFHITPEERRLNQEMVAEDNADPFADGTLVPVRLLDDSADARELAASNPNLMSESDMKELVAGHHKTFESKIGEITNTTTLRRLLEIARNEDASVGKVERLMARIDQLSAPRQSMPERPEQRGPDREPPVTGRAITPR